ncbi:hypothetical protein JW960_05995 [candidate division KSB1 bacterium]|nr:hypothetical protein [candidate division KSB1 bacterium]
MDVGEDIGLDGMYGKDPDDYWDINGNGIQDWYEPISNDDWSFSPNDGSYSKFNRTENNHNSTYGIYPDTEVINHNGILDTLNNYNEYSINLDKNSSDNSFIVGENMSKGW